MNNEELRMLKEETMSPESRNIWIAAGLIAMFFIFSGWAQEPAQEEDSRRLWDSEFLKKRNAGKPPSTGSSTVRKTTAYRRITPKQSENKPAESEMIGITIWRLRPSKQVDSQESRLLLDDDEGAAQVEWTLERVESETKFAAGDRVRLGIESPRNGYLYVIDREQYADGSSSDPYLIFPTLRNRNGDNSVSAGKVIELPARSAFRLKPMRQDYAGETLTVMVAPQPLTEVTVGPRIVKLDRAMVDGWEKQWGAMVERFELIDGAGKPYSKAEKEAGREGARILTQEDEMPQTLYRIIAKPGQPLLVTVQLRIKR
jgi:hypothetical protein